MKAAYVPLFSVFPNILDFFGCNLFTGYLGKSDTFHVVFGRISDMSKPV